MKLRLRSTKLGRVRFVSHRDAARLWERAMRKVGLPVAFTEGFTPRPKLSFGLALPTGAESISEYLDVELVGDVVEPGDPHFHDALSAALPRGINVIASELAHGDSLQQAVSSTTWELLLPDVERAHAVEACERLLAADNLPLERVRKGQLQTDDVRPAIADLRVRHRTDVSAWCADGADSAWADGHTPAGLSPRSGGIDWCIAADLVTIGRALRPAELVAAAFPQTPETAVGALRTYQWTTFDDERREVIALGTSEGTSGHVLTASTAPVGAATGPDR